MTSKVDRTHLAFTALFALFGVAGTSQEISALMKNQNDIHRMLYYASLAGNSHNSQPWKAEVYPNDSVLIFADFTRQLKVVDPQGVELYLSIGAFIENLDAAAKALGYQTNLSLFKSGIQPSLPVACISLRKTEMAYEPEALREMELRRSLRIPFERRAIEKCHQAKLESLAPGYIRIVPSDSDLGRFISRKESEAFSIQSNEKEAQEELASWMRFSDKDVNTKCDGLSPAGMGIKGMAGFFVRHFFKPEDSKKESFVKSGIEKTRRQVQNCGGWIVISIEKDEPHEWIHAGRIYERLNNQCRGMNLGFHPMNQIIEVPPVFKEFSEKMGYERIIRFVARIGYVKDYPCPVSKRRTVEEFSLFMK